MQNEINNSNISQVKLPWLCVFFVLQQLIPNCFYPTTVHFFHQFFRVVFVLYNQRQHILNQIFPPQKIVHYQCIFDIFSQQLQMATLFNNIFTHRKGLGDNVVTIYQKRQLLKEPIISLFFLIDFPTQRIEKNILIGNIQILTDQAAYINISSIRIRTNHYSIILCQHHLLKLQNFIFLILIQEQEIQIFQIFYCFLPKFCITFLYIIFFVLFHLSYASVQMGYLKNHSFFLIFDQIVDFIKFYFKTINSFENLLFDYKQQMQIKSNMKDQIISEQIDIVVIGSKSFQLLQILLNKDLKLVPMPKLKNKYLNTLWSLYSNQTDVSTQQPSKFPAHSQANKIQKYTTNLLTQSFWLQFNFFYFGSTSYDPLLAGISRGRISICIIASSEQEAEQIELKKLLTKDTGHTSLRLKESIDLNKGNNREELIMEQKIMNCIHNFKLNDFSSVLTLKMIDKNRIIEGTSNFKLSRNQILRWIVDRHFQNEFGIKLRGEVGDEIQNYRQNENQSYCSLM